MMIFSVDATFLQSQFIKKLICDLISQPNLEIFKLIEGYFKAILKIFLRFSFMQKELNFNIYSANFYPFSKSSSLSKNR